MLLFHGVIEVRADRLLDDDGDWRAGALRFEVQRMHDIALAAEAARGPGVRSAMGTRHGNPFLGGDELKSPSRMAGVIE